MISEVDQFTAMFCVFLPGPWCPPWPQPCRRKRNRWAPPPRQRAGCRQQRCSRDSPSVRPALGWTSCKPDIIWFLENEAISFLESLGFTCKKSCSDWNPPLGSALASVSPYQVWPQTTFLQCAPLSLVEAQRGSALIGRELHSVATPVSLMP